jgi:hypothetical protein
MPAGQPRRGNVRRWAPPAFFVPSAFSVPSPLSCTQTPPNNHHRPRHNKQQASPFARFVTWFFTPRQTEQVSPAAALAGKVAFAGAVVAVTVGVMSRPRPAAASADKIKAAQEAAARSAASQKEHQLRAEGFKQDAVKAEEAARSAADKATAELKAAEQAAARFKEHVRQAEGFAHEAQKATQSAASAASKRKVEHKAGLLDAKRVNEHTYRAEDLVAKARFSAQDEAINQMLKE